MEEQTTEQTSASAPEQPSTGSNESHAALESTGKLEAVLEEYFVKKAPFQIPLGGKEFIVKVAPYLVILGVLFAIPATLFVIVVSPLVVLGGGGVALLSMFFSVAALVLEAIALPGLFKLTRGSWNLLFYASLVSIAGTLVGLHLVNAVISALIGWYILFQVKELYKN